MKTIIMLCLVLNSTLALANASEKHLRCQLKDVLDSTVNPSKALDVYANLADAKKTTINGTAVHDALDPEIAKYLGMAQIVNLNNEQISISLDFKKVYIKDVASYSCETLN